MAYTTVVALVASLPQPSEPHKSPGKGSDPTVHAASSEAATKRMSIGDMSGPLCGMVDGTTKSAHVASYSAAPTVERKNKTSIYVSEARTRAAS